MIKKYPFVIFYFFFSIFLTFNALSEEEATSGFKKPKVKTKVIYKKQTEFDFSGETIDGDYKRPEGFYMVHRATTDFAEIIKFDLRFKDNVKKSVGYLE